MQRFKLAMLRRTPVLFLSHGGGPCFFMDGKEFPMFADIDKHSSAKLFLENVVTNIKSEGYDVKYILIISAHWEETNHQVTYHMKPTPLLYDYYGFPEFTYCLEYKPPTDLNLADSVIKLLEKNNIICEKSTRGFDHGTFIPLLLANKEQDIPVVQLSLVTNLNCAHHFKLGEILSELRNEGVLIIGSGAITHNLREFSNVGKNVPAPHTKDFTDYVFNLIESKESSDFEQYREKFMKIMEVAPSASRCHPRVEHLIPLIVAAGAGSTSRGKRIFNFTCMGTFSLDSYIWKEQ